MSTQCDYLQGKMPQTELLGNSQEHGIVPKSVRMNPFLEAGALGGFLTGVPNGFRIDRPLFAKVAGEQPSAGFAMVVTPMGAQCRE